jgi:hypothetical protein
MLGIVPGVDQTFIVEGTIQDTTEFIHGRLYVDDQDDRLYMCLLGPSKRISAETGFFPVFDGKFKYSGKFANEKYFSKDARSFDLGEMIEKVDEATRNEVETTQKHCSDNEPLEPCIRESDNAFTQCVKKVIEQKGYTLTQLSEMSLMSDKMIKNKYTVLNKISFMRLDQFEIWIKSIFHMNFVVTVKDAEGKFLVKYKTNGSDTFETNSPEKSNVPIMVITTNEEIDFMKKLIHIMMYVKDITKAQLHDEEDKADSAIKVNNLLVLLNGTNPIKPFSAQLFSRFIKMVGYSYTIDILEDGQEIFTYMEG